MAAITETRNAGILPASNRAREYYPSGWFEVEGQLIRADRIIRDGILKLSSHQATRRSYRRENEIAREVNRGIEEAAVFDCIAGIDTLQGLGIRYRGVTSIFDVNGNPSKPLQTVFEEKVEGSWVKGIYRGDQLGYPVQLGKDWYLVFWGKGEHEGTHFAPVAGIKDFTLKPFDVGF